jgi:hypothetical protein
MQRTSQLNAALEFIAAVEPIQMNCNVQLELTTLLRDNKLLQLAGSVLQVTNVQLRERLA